MQKAEENDGYSKLSIRGRDAYLRAEFDPREISVSSLLDVLDPVSPLSLTVRRLNGSNSTISVTADITVKVEETAQKLDLSLTQSMRSSSSEWSIRLDSFLDIFPCHTVYICAIFICKVELFSNLQRQSLFIPSPPMLITPKRMNGLFNVATSTVDVISSKKRKQFIVSKELLSLHSPFFTTIFYEDYREKKTDQHELHSIEGETFDICLAFEALQLAIKVGYSTKMCDVFMLADRYCMDRVKSGLEEFMIISDLTNLLISDVMEWIRTADATGRDELMCKLIDRVSENPSDLFGCFKVLNEIVSAPTRVKIVEKLYTFVDEEHKKSHKGANLIVGSVDPKSFWH